MAKKILKALTNNLGYKLLAVFFALILWLVVYNIDDPTKTRTFTTNVTIENTSAVTDMNKCYEVLNGSNTVTFSVTAKRSILDKLEDTDFTATADMNRMILGKDGTNAIVPVEIVSRRQNSALKYNGKNKYLEVSLENLMSHRFMISPAAKGQVAEGFALGEVTVTNPNVLSVSGPSSIVKKIASVVATIDVDGMSMNLSDNVIPVLYDANGKEVDTTRLKLSNDTVAISAKILSVKELPLSFTTSGKPYGDYRVVEISSSPTSVKLKGASNILNPLMSIDVPSDVLNVSGAKDDISTSIDITEYLPDGIELVDSADANVTVTVRIEAYKAKTYEINSNSVTVKGLEEGYELTFEDVRIPVMINGLKKDLDRLNVSEIPAEIDVTGLKEGTHRVTLNLKLNEENYAYQPITIAVSIAPKEQRDEQTENPEETGGSEQGSSENNSQDDEQKDEQKDSQNKDQNNE